MPRFRFPLENVLSWRRAELLAEETRLAPVVAEAQRLDRLREEMAGAREHAQDQLLAAGAVDGSDLAALASYRIWLGKRQAAVERQSAQCRQQVAAQRGRVVEAHRRLRLLEKLKEHRLEEWRAAEERDIENFASEAFLARWPARRLRGKN